MVEEEVTMMDVKRVPDSPMLGKMYNYQNSSLLNRCKVVSMLPSYSRTEYSSHRQYPLLLKSYIDG